MNRKERKERKEERAVSCRRQMFEHGASPCSSALFALFAVQNPMCVDLAREAPDR
jgi:hypothetical protein